MSFHWSTSPFQILYEAIVSQNIDVQVQQLELLQKDFLNLILHPKKNEVNRKKLETGKIQFSDQVEYELNKEFIENGIKLSDSLDIDELAAAEILYYSSLNEFEKIGATFLDSANAAYYTRRAFILQITSYYLCSTSSFSNLSSEDAAKKKFVNLILADDGFALSVLLQSFKSIDIELNSIKQLVERTKLLEHFNKDSPFMKNVSFRRDALFKDHQYLGEILFGFISLKGEKFSLKDFNLFLNHVASFEPQDIFMLSYIPGLFKYVSSLAILKDEDVKFLHNQFDESINDLDKLSESPVKSLIILVFLTNFIDWCTNEPSRTKQFDFTTTVDEPMQKVIAIGAFEELLSITADSSLVFKSPDERVKPFYDFRTFLQQHIPKFVAHRMMDIDDVATLELKRILQEKKLNGITIDESQFKTIYSDGKDITLENHFIDFLVPILSSFIHKFISNAAFMMTRLRDTEEDLLISSEDFNLEALTEGADLERFYISMYYLYFGRTELCSEFWQNTSSSLYGFLQWASRCNSPLIMSTYSMVLAALASGDQNAMNAFNFLQLTNTNNSNALTTSLESSSLISKYSSVSWSTIYSSLAYFNTALSKVRNESTQSGSENSAVIHLKSNQQVVSELGEDSVIYISGFLQILSEVGRNSSKARVELLESDNYQLLSILTMFLKNNTPLSGSVLVTLSCLVGDTIDDRTKFFQLLDNWVFQSFTSSHRNHVSDIPKDIIAESLGSFNLISGFSDLISRLLEPLEMSKDPFNPLQHQFPLDLGSLVRKPGIWCYIDFLCSEVFPSSLHSGLDDDQKTKLQLSILNLMAICLEQLDPDLVLNSTACHLKDMDNITSYKSIIRYFQSHPGSAVMNCIHKTKVYSTLFQLANLGIDGINESAEDSKHIQVVGNCLKVIDMILARERFFIDELVPILRLQDNIFAESSCIGTFGMRSFYDAFLLNLPFVANVSLYVSSTKLDISYTSLSILKKITASSIFNGGESSLDYNLLNKNRLLVMFETVDESVRIRYSFIEQFEASITTPKSVAVKVRLLQYLNKFLPFNSAVPTVTHFLLGFDTRKMTMGRETDDGSILSSRSLFKSIIYVLKETTTMLSDVTNIEYPPVRLCALCMEIVLKLCKSNLFGLKVLSYLRNSLQSNFVLMLMQNTKKIYTNTYWCGEKFDDKVNTNNDFVSNGEGMCALTALVSYRSSLLQLIALELHVASSIGSISLISKYMETLTISGGFSTGSPKILELLDLLDFKPKNMIEKMDQLFSSFDFKYVFKKIILKDEPLVSQCASPYDLNIIDKLIGLFAKESQGLLNPSQHEENLQLFQSESRNLKKIITCSISFDNFKVHIFEYLHSWVLLVQVIVSEGQMKANNKSNFILQIFQSIMPKVDEYMQADITYAEDLVSLCVYLFHIYEADKQVSLSSLEEQETKAQLYYNRLFPLFKICMKGILLPDSTSSIRSDFYVLANNYLQLVIMNRKVITELMIFVRSIDLKLFNIICNDSLVGEGPCRVTSLMLLETFVKIMIKLQSAQVEENFIFEIFCKGNYLLLLVQKLKTTDDIFCSCLDNGKHSVSLQSLLYELTTFKSGVYLLIRIGQTRVGAQQLIQSDLFNIIKDCRFLMLDADLGFELILEEYKDSEKSDKFTRMKISLDNPLAAVNSVANDFYKGFNSLDKISYYEIFTPIFQLVTTVVISLGPQNETCIKQAALLEKHFEKLIAAVLKRDVLYESYRRELEEKGQKLEDKLEISGPLAVYSEENVVGLKELTKLFTLLDSLVL